MAKGKGSGGKRPPAPAGSNASAAAGASVASDKAAKSAADKELRAECAKAFSYYRKGNETRAVKELERLVKSHPAHRFPASRSSASPTPAPSSSDRSPPS